METLYVNASSLKGNQVKQLFFTPSGVLVYENNTYTFINPETLKERSVIGENPAYVGKVVFVSDEFGLSKLLDSGKTYDVEFNRDFLVFKIKGKVELVIHGKRI